MPLTNLQELMTRLIEDIMSFHKTALYKLPETKSLPLSVLKLTDRFFKLFDESCLRFISSRKESRKVTCKMGCHLCCYQMPSGISTIEYIYLYHGIWRSSSKRLYLPRLLDRGEVLSELVKDFGDSLETMLETYSKKMILCSFLDKSSGLCEVYEFRPLVCRMHVSFEPPWLCHPKSDQCRAVNIEPSPILSASLKKLDDAFCFKLSEFMVFGITEFMVNVMRCHPIVWK